MNDELLKKLDKRIRSTKFWFMYYKVVDLWFNGISVILSISVPPLLLISRYAEIKAEDSFNLAALIISLIAMILTIVTKVANLRSVSSLNHHCLVEYEKLKNKYFHTKSISDDNVIEEMYRIAQMELKEDTY